MAQRRRADVVIMAAAVADYTPERARPQKIAKADGRSTLTLSRTPDILAELGARAGGRAAGRFSSASPPKPATSSRAPARSSRESRST